MNTSTAAPAPSAATQAGRYLLIAGLLAASWLFSVKAPVLFGTVGAIHSGGSLLVVLFEIVLIFVFGFLAYEVSKPTVIPSFVLAVLIGMIQRGNLAVIVGNTEMLTALTTLGAIFILFGGGLDTPFARFRELIGPILSIAFIGTLVTALLFSLILSTVSPLLGVALPVGAVILIGAALSSTDPAAIIPSFKSLVFRNPRMKYIAVSESAINDVVGAVLTGVFLSLLIGGLSPHSIVEPYLHLLSAETGMEVIAELLIGTAAGVGGFLILFAWNRWKARGRTGGEADAALFLAVPLLCYMAATLLGGSGFLAVFVSSLLFHIEEHFQHVEHYFNHTIEGFMKPLIFMLLGATVDPAGLLQVAGLGIVMGLLFMFVIRPIAVFLTLCPFMAGRHKLTVRELLFLSFVRETGVIPAVLLVGLRVSGIEGADTAVAVGLWVILLTLIVQPPLTPFVARSLGIATDVSSFPVRKRRGAAAVLCSRGLSFIDRMDTVVEWADKHAVSSVVLLHCPEAKYAEDMMKGIRKRAETLFDALNAERKAKGKKPIAFEFIGRQGLLQDNIEQLLREDDDVSIVFVGSKMLDYRLEDVKKLSVPFIFVR